MRINTGSGLQVLHHGVSTNRVFGFSKLFRFEGKNRLGKKQCKKRKKGKEGERKKIVAYFISLSQIALNHHFSNDDRRSQNLVRLWAGVVLTARSTKLMNRAFVSHEDKISTPHVLLLDR
jgi:hypothetical protein